MKIEWKTMVKIIGIAVIVYLFIHYWDKLASVFILCLSASGPLLLGTVFAYVVHIPMSVLEKNMFKNSRSKKILGLKRPVSMILTMLGFVMIIWIIMMMIIPQLTLSLQLMANKLPAQLNDVYLYLEHRFHISDFIPGIQNLIQNNSIDWENVVTKAVDYFMNGFGNAAGSVVGMISSVFSTISTLVIALIFSIYLLIGKEKILNQLNCVLKAYLKEERRNRLVRVLKTFDETFHSFIVGQCAEAVIIGTLCALGMALLRFPYAVMIGCLVGLTALIPVAGAYIGAVVGAFMIFTVSPYQAVLFVIYLVVLQQLEGNLIYPKVVGSSIGLPGVWVLAAVTIGGGLSGIFGMLIGVPITASFYKLLKIDVEKRYRQT